MKLSVIIPAYNEEKRIGHTLQAVGDYLQKQNYDYEIVVVVNGSHDRTFSVVQQLAATTVKNIVPVNLPEGGKGNAVRRGMLEFAKGDIRMFMDADNSTTVDHIEKFLPYFEQGYDVVVGSRRIEGSDIAVHQPWFRDFQGTVFRTIVHTLVPVHVTDTQCGFKAFSAKAAETIFAKQTIQRWAFDVEILALARKFGFKIKELPVRWVNDEGSVMTLSGKVHMLVEVFQVRLNLWSGKYQ